jgi:hypothetical protein
MGRRMIAAKPGQRLPSPPRFCDKCDMEFSDYIVYADESGDHSLTSIDRQFPVFVLAFCLVHKPAYIDQVVPAFQRFKFEFWGHDGVVLHGHDIRKAQGDFNILLNATTRKGFLSA